jgi:hypothetical protein
MLKLTGVLLASIVVAVAATTALRSWLPPGVLIMCNFGDPPSIEKHVAEVDTIIVGRVLLAWPKEHNFSEMSLARFRNGNSDTALIAVDRYLKGEPRASPFVVESGARICGSVDFGRWVGAPMLMFLDEWRGLTVTSLFDTFGLEHPDSLSKLANVESITGKGTSVDASPLAIVRALPPAIGSMIDHSYKPLTAVFLVPLALLLVLSFVSHEIRKGNERLTDPYRV